MKSLLSFDGFRIEGATLVVTPLFLAIVAAVLVWPRTTASETLLQLIFPTTVAHVPMFSIMYVLTTWLVTILFYFMGVASNCTTGFDNKSPRDKAKDKSLGWMYRMHCAHDNTLECLVWMTATIFVADKLELDETLVAKWCTLIVVSRTFYPIFYVLDIDALRTTSFAVGFFSAFVMGWVAVFPDAMLPYCTTTS